MGNGYLDSLVASTADFLLIHTNSLALSEYPDRIRRLRGYGKPILINEDSKTGSSGAAAAATAVHEDASWGFLLRANQAFPFTFEGIADDPVVYDAIQALTGSDR